MNHLSLNFDILSPLDVRDGQFALVQSKILFLYNSLPGIRGQLAVSILTRIISSVYVSEGEGDVWSSVFSINDIIGDIYPSFSDKEHFENTKGNVFNYIKDLLNNNIFYRFGKNGNYSYTYEKNIFSWGYFCEDKSYVYPYTIKKILKTEKDLCNIMWHNEEDSDSREKFPYEFSNFIYGLIQKTPDCVKDVLSPLEKDRGDARLYLDLLSKKLSKIDNFKGVEKGTFKLSKLPMNIQNSFRDKKFSNIIPEDKEPGFSVRSTSIGKSKSYAIRQIAKALEKANDMPENELELSKEPYHFLSFLERKIKTSCSLHKDSTIYGRISAEKLSCSTLLDKTVGIEDREMFLRKWAVWFSENVKGKNIFDGDFVISKEMMKTYSIFKKEYDKKNNLSFLDEGAPSSDIYSDLKNDVDSDMDILKLNLKYGIFKTYNYLSLTLNKDRCKELFLNFINEVKLMGEDDRKKYLSNVIISTVKDKMKESGLFAKDERIRSGINSLLEENKCLPKDLGLSFAKIPPTSCLNFWKRVEYVSNSRTEK